MENEELLTEKNYNKYRKLWLTLAIIGIVLMVISIVIMIRGNFMGLQMLLIAIFLTLAGFLKYYQRQIVAAETETVMPVKTEAINKGTQQIAPALNTVTGAIASGIKKANDEEYEPSAIKEKLANIEKLKAENLVTASEYESLRKKILGL